MTSITQFFLALFVGWCGYMLAMAMTVYDGALSLVFQPFIGAVFTSFALTPVFAVGLPIRFIAPLYSWWRAHWWISLVLGAVAVGLMIASWLPANRVQVVDPELGTTRDSFHPWLALSGWFLAMFAAAHFYPPTKRAAAEPHP